MKLSFLTCLLTVFCYLARDAAAKLAPHIWCGACIAMVEDMKIQISAVDKRKKLQVGSFRILPDGTQQLKEVPYATSDLFLTEELERICNAMHHYAETTDAKSGQKIIIRTSSYDGTSVSMKNVVKSAEITQALQHACYTIIEDHEDEIVKLLKGYNRKDSEVEKDICVNETGLCSDDDVKNRMWAMANAVMAGIQEKADERLRESQAQEELDQETADADSAASDSDDTVTEDVTEESPENESSKVTDEKKDEL